MTVNELIEALVDIRQRGGGASPVTILTTKIAAGEIVSAYDNLTHVHLVPRESFTRSASIHDGTKPDPNDNPDENLHATH